MGHLHGCIEWAQLPVEEIDDTMRFRDDEGVHVRLGG